MQRKSLAPRPGHLTSRFGVPRVVVAKTGPSPHLRPRVDTRSVCSCVSSCGTPDATGRGDRSGAAWVHVDGAARPAAGATRGPAAALPPGGSAARGPRSLLPDVPPGPLAVTPGEQRAAGAGPGNRVVALQRALGFPTCLAWLCFESVSRAVRWAAPGYGPWGQGHLLSHQARACLARPSRGLIVPPVRPPLGR